MTTSPGRNAPCPCGSGRKYKHCCLRKAEALPRPAYSERERQEAFAKLVRFARREEFTEDVRGAESLFWAGRLDVAPPERRRELEADEHCFLAFLHWLIFDLPLDLVGAEEGAGTIADRFVASRGAALSSGERAYLQRMRASCLRLYEVVEVRLDEELSLEDVWTGETVQVRERLATHQLARWDLLAVRVIDGPAGAQVLDGTPYLYPCDAKAAIVADLKRHHARIKRELGSDDPVRFFKRVGMRFQHLWLDYVALRPMPTVVTAEGDPVVLVKSAFDIIERERVAEALAAHPELELQDDGSYAWMEEASGMTRLLGTLVVGPERLILETTSEARAERGRSFVEGLGGDAVRFRAAASEDLAQALAHAPQPAREAPPGVPPEVQQEVVTRFYEEHYRAWLDEPVPALGGRTPRHAARLKTARHQVIDLLKGLENQMERERQAGRPAYDVQWMWAELGLERP